MHITGPGNDLLKLALGPVLYYWQRDKLLNFYDEIAVAPVDIVYLGETVCSRRHLLRIDDWLAVAERLSATGKEVVLSTQALLESESDLKTLRKITANGHFMVEANDMGAVGLLAGQGDFVAGLHLNMYNTQMLEWLAGLGARRWVMPVEMSRASLCQMQAERPAGMATEVFAYGRLPLAFSARCFTARHYNLPKDDCQFRCLDYPDGLALKTREGQPFLTLNGIQTQSANRYNLLGELDAMIDAGVDSVRVSPQAFHTPRILELFRARLDGEISAVEAMSRLGRWTSDTMCDGYWYGNAGMAQSVPAE